MTRVRYQQLSRGGVYDYDTGLTIKRGEPGWDEYQAWMSAGNVPLPPTDKIPTLLEASADIKKAIEDYGVLLRNKAYLGISPWEAVAWAFKFPEAKKIEGYGASTTAATIKTNNPRIWQEAEIRGIHVRDLAARIVQKAEAFWDKESRIAGIVGKHCDAIDKLTDVRDVLFYNWQADWPEV